MYLPHNILIIEDNLLNQKIISFWLTKYKYAFEFVSSGEDALVKFTMRWYDVIIMDIMLPGINGYETTSLIREFGQVHYKKQPYIVAITANTLDNDRRRCLEAGMDEYLAKPFDIQQLNGILGDHFSNT